jgi:hypothetical protein
MHIRCSVECTRKKLLDLPSATPLPSSYLGIFVRLGFSYVVVVVEKQKKKQGMALKQAKS